MEVPHGQIIAGRPMVEERVQVASVQTLVRRLDKLAPPDMVVVDEAHHATAATYRTIIQHCPDSWLIGLTATPARMDGTGLDDIFDALVHGPELASLIEQGHLSPFRVFTPPTAISMKGVHTRAGDWVKEELEERMDSKTITGDAIEHYRRFVHPASCLVYCVSRQHARHVEAQYREAGLDALYVAGDTPKQVRDRAIEGFRFGSPRIISSVDLFGEGLDVPGLGAVQLLRPTQSLGLYLQQVGRALRREEGKSHAVILDHVGNVWRHGFPDDEREWTLEGRKRRAKAEGDGAPDLRQCKACFCVYRASLSFCPLCGAEAEVKSREVEQVEGQLVEVDELVRARLREQAKRKKKEQGRAGTLEDLVELALQRGNKVAWAGIVWAKRTGTNQGQAIGEAYRIAKEMRG
jgi:superfamily II DNA or RNA helicase